MKLPSIGSIGAAAVKTAVKYPAPLAMAALTAVIAIYSQEAYNSEKFEVLRIMFTAALGAALFLAAQLLPASRKFKTVLFVVVAAFLIVYDLNFQKIESYMYSYVLHCFAAVFAVILAPFALKKDKNIELWERTKSLFLRAALAVLYSHVLFGGLALALASIEQLFGVNWYQWFHIRIYFDLWMIMGFLVGPWIFLAGIPEPGAEEEPKPLAKSVRAFALYVLLPIAGIYLLILYAYAINIIIKWELPNGWVTALILTYSGVGIVTLLLLYPLLTRGELGAKFARAPKVFFATLLPLLVLLYFAIARRLADYGLTENRYFVIISLIWLAGVSIYYLIEGFTKIKPIPLSILITLILTSFGPWGAFQMAEASQTQRLLDILKNSGAIKNSKLVKGVKFSQKSANEIVRLDSYLRHMHGSRLLSGELASYGVKFNTYDERYSLLKVLDSKSLKEYYGETLYNISIEREYEINLDGEERLIRIEDATPDYYNKETYFGNEKINLYTKPENGRSRLMMVTPGGEAYFDLSEAVNKLSSRADAERITKKPVKDMTFETSATDFKYKLIVTHASYKYDPEIKIESFDGFLFIKPLKK